MPQKDFSAEQKKECAALKKSAHLNSAAAHLKLGDYKDAIASANKACTAHPCRCDAPTPPSSATAAGRIYPVPSLLQPPTLRKLPCGHHGNTWRCAFLDGFLHHRHVLTGYQVAGYCYSAKPRDKLLRRCSRPSRAA